MSTNLYKSFLRLVRLGIATSKEAKIYNSIDWVEMKALADEHGLSAVVLDGLDELRVKSGELRVSSQEKILLAEWIGEVYQLYEQRYEQYSQAIADLAAFYNSHGYKMMVLKGYACSLDWQKPNHRPCGDIDIWLLGNQREADKVLTRERKIKIDNSHHHHSVFCWNNFMVENHYDFINIHHHRSHKGLERILKELGQDDSHYVEMNGEKVYLPSHNLHALFLLKHTALHFVSGEISLRQILDWGFFVEKHSNKVDWKWLLSVLDEYGLLPFFNILNAICVEELGFEMSSFPTISYNPVQKERALNDILMGANISVENTNVILRQVNRFRRWKGNQWKHELCYKESMCSAFWSGVWNHLLKPSTI